MKSKSGTRASRKHWERTLWYSHFYSESAREEPSSHPQQQQTQILQSYV
jgi:hypothetical protein